MTELLDRLLAIEAVAIAHLAIFFLPDGNMLHVVFAGLDGTARFEDEGVQTFFGEFLGSPASGDAGTDHDGVIRFDRHELVRSLRFFRQWSTLNMLRGDDLVM